jgi:type I restriction enzyme M protein
LPDIREKWLAREKAKKNDRKAKHFFVPVKEIRDNRYELSVNRYREVANEEINHVAPKQLIAELTEEEQEIEQGLKKLEGMVQ